MEPSAVTAADESEPPRRDLLGVEPKDTASGGSSSGGGEAEGGAASASVAAGGERGARKQEGTRARRGRHSGAGGVRRGAHHLAAKFRGCRKRAYSFPSISKFFLPHKRPRKEAFIPPTKFLLGGNISDPLNLNSLQDEDVNRAMNAVTPKSSPLPTPPRHKGKVDVIIPPDFRDPLNLLHPLSDDEYERRFEAQRLRRQRKRAKTRRRASESGTCTQSSGASAPVCAAPAAPDRTEPETPAATGSPPPPAGTGTHCTDRAVTESDSSATKQKETKKLRRMDSLDKIVSPVVPQPGAWTAWRARPPPRHAPRISHERPPPVSPRRHVATGALDQHALPKFDPKKERYQYGNYDRYYGYRNMSAAMDVRLQVFQLHRHLFHNKDVLDVGCNVGHVSIAAARELGARSVTGIDIDHQLIAAARRNLRRFVSVPPEPGARATACVTCAAVRCDHGEQCDQCVPTKCDECTKTSAKRNKRRKKNKRQQSGRFFFPASFSLLYGPIELPGQHTGPEPRPFPHNVVFKQGNYVVKEEGLLGATTAQYDLILCLSTTKWMHLNWGDAGLKLAFRRMFAELRPGGKLILEAQNWASYAKKKRLTPQIYENYNSLELFPSKFREYLLSPEVGFSKCCVLGVPQHTSKGFRRPVHLYVKGDFTPSKAQWSDAYAPPSSQHRPDAPPPRRTVYVAAPSPSPRPGPAPYSPASPFYYTPAAPFLEPSPGHSHACTPSHASSASVAPRAHKYALHSPLRQPLSSPRPDDSALD